MFQTLLQDHFTNSHDEKTERSLEETLYLKALRTPNVHDYMNAKDTSDHSEYFLHDNHLNYVRDSIERIETGDDVVEVCAYMHRIGMNPLFRTCVDNQHSATKQIICKVHNSVQSMGANSAVAVVENSNNLRERIDEIHEWTPTIHFHLEGVHVNHRSRSTIHVRINQLVSKYSNNYDHEHNIHEILDVGDTSLSPPTDKFRILYMYCKTLYQTYRHFHVDEKGQLNSSSIPESRIRLSMNNEFYFEELYNLIYSSSLSIDDWKLYFCKLMSHFERNLFASYCKKQKVQSSLWFLTNHVCWKVISSRKYMQAELKRAETVFQTSIDFYREHIRTGLLHERTKEHISYFLDTLEVVHTCSPPPWFAKQLRNTSFDNYRVQEDYVMLGNVLKFYFNTYKLFDRKEMYEYSEQSSFGMQMCTLSQSVSYNKFQHKVFVSPTALVTYCLIHRNSSELLRCRYCLIINNILCHVLLAREINQCVLNYSTYTMFSPTEMKNYVKWTTFITQHYLGLSDTKTLTHLHRVKAHLVVSKVHAYLMSYKISQRTTMTHNKMNLIEFISFVNAFHNPIDKIAIEVLRQNIYPSPLL